MAMLKPTSARKARVRSTWMPKPGVTRRIMHASHNHESGATARAMTTMRREAKAWMPARNEANTAPKREPGAACCARRVSTIMAIAEPPSAPPKMATRCRSRGDRADDRQHQRRGHPPPEIEPAIDDLGAEDGRAALAGAPAEVLPGRSPPRAQAGSTLNMKPTTWAR